MLVLRNLAEVFIRALAIGMAEQRARGVHGQYTTRPNGRPIGNAIKRKRPSGSGWQRQGAREMERRRAQWMKGMLRFHSYGHRP